ncbi:MAG: PilX N-terminal domain-containing pilus assembly protein [Rhodopseudomonas palustris]|nr:PilX N-terminal domain-containing pilus assembly protein [Rhodopseudomonas palustris]
MNFNRVKEVFRKLKMVLQDREGMVLILVLIVLVAAIITGVTIMRTSALEARIAGNERAYVDNFNTLESATSYALTMNTAALAAVATTEGATFTFLMERSPKIFRVRVSLPRLDDITGPPIGSGNDESLKTRYYIIQAQDDEGSQTSARGAYKVFPPTKDF